MEFISSSESIVYENKKDENYINKVKELYNNKKCIFDINKCRKHKLNDSFLSVEQLNTNKYYKEKRSKELKEITNFIHNMLKIPKKNILKKLNKKNITKINLIEKLKKILDK